MRTPLRAAAVLAALGMLVGCGQTPDRSAEESESADTVVVPGWVGEVADVANAIEAQPGAADSILAAHDMTRMAFDSLLYEVAADPALTTAYEEARQ